jgi:transposase
VCDNAPYHARLEQVETMEGYEGVTILRLSPYSPFLNPIENVWQVVKARVKNEMRREYDALLAGDPQGNLTIMEWRLRFLECIARSATSGINIEGCCNSIKHIRVHFNKCLEKQNIY